MVLRRLLVLGLMAMLALLPAYAADEAHAPDPVVVKIIINGAISPASADHIIRGLEYAQSERAAAVLLQMDTPGGLASAMRDIIKSILNSTVPVISYVAPRGARAASAGTYILYASHVAAMAPSTNLGAATPVSITGSGALTRKRGSKEDADDSDTPTAADSAEMRKATNDAVAYIRSLAQQHNRNADWAEKAVREAASLSATEALEQDVIDLVADHEADLLARIDGRTVQVPGGEVQLATRGAVVQTYEAGLRSRFLDVIANPSVALILLLLGLGGLVMEGTHPGGILPGVVGAICLLLALYAFQLLPVNFAGLGLMLLGVILMVSEIFVPAMGILAIGGAIATVVGAVILMRSGSAAFGVALPTIVGIAIAGVGVIAGIIWLAIRSHMHPVVSGSEEMIGAIGTVVQDFSGRGLIHVHGERWQAESAVPLRKGQRVVVVSRDGLVLQVRAQAEGTNTIKEANA